MSICPHSTDLTAHAVCFPRHFKNQSAMASIDRLQSLSMRRVYWCRLAFLSATVGVLGATPAIGAQPPALTMLSRSSNTILNGWAAGCCTYRHTQTFTQLSPISTTDQASWYVVAGNCGNEPGFQTDLQLNFTSDFDNSTIATTFSGSGEVHETGCVCCVAGCRVGPGAQSMDSLQFDVPGRSIIEINMGGQVSLVPNGGSSGYQLHVYSSEPNATFFGLHNGTLNPEFYSSRQMIIRNQNGWLRLGINPGRWNYEAFFSAYPNRPCPSLDGSFSIDAETSLTVVPCGPGPIAVSQPADAVVCEGATARFTFAVENAGTFQWRKNLIPLIESDCEVSGVNSRTLVITNAHADDAGAYDCVVTDAFGGMCAQEIQSLLAQLVVGPPESICPCPPDIGKSPTRWNIAASNVNSCSQDLTPMTAGSGWEDQFDCSEPTVLVIHGWQSDPCADWMPCIANAIRARYPDGDVNILVADASTYMLAADGAIGGFAAGGYVGAAVGLSATASAGLALTALAAADLFTARNNIPRAAEELSQDIECFVNPCGGANGVDMIVGHSFGGAIGAEIGTRLVAGTGNRIPLLVTIDTPWNVFGLLTLDTQAAAAEQYFTNHVNYFSPCRSSVGFGTALTAANVRNFNAHPGPTVEAQTQCLLEHTCSLPMAACSLLTSGDGMSLFSGALPPGDYLEGAVSGTVVPGSAPNECGEFDLPPWDAGPLLVPPFTEEFIPGVGGTIDAGVLEQRLSGSGLTGSSGVSVSLSSCPGFLVFEYQIEGLSESQVATLHWNGDLVWSAWVNTPEGEWKTGLVDLRPNCLHSFQITASLEPAIRGSSSPTGVFRLRNVRIARPDIIECTEAPFIVLQPESNVSCQGALVAFATVPDWTFGVSYVWRRNEIPLADGVDASGETVVGSHSPLLLLIGVSASNAGTYDCVITNSCGSTMSDGATLIVSKSSAADADGNGSANGADIDGFIKMLIEGSPPGISPCALDMNLDGIVNLNDLPLFVRALLEG